MVRRRDHDRLHRKHFTSFDIIVSSDKVQRCIRIVTMVIYVVPATNKFLKLLSTADHIQYNILQKVSRSCIIGI